MHITINGIRFDIDALHPAGLVQPSETAEGRALIERKLYTWDCAKPEDAEMHQTLDADGFLEMDPFVAVAEPAHRRPRQPPNTTQTLAMTLKVLRALKLRGVSDLEAEMKKFLKPHKIKVDLSSYDWLKPYASFDIWMHVDYHYFELTNKIQKLRLMVGIPHRVWIRAKVTGICKSEEFWTKLKGGKRIRNVDLGLTGKGSAEARAMRSAVLRRILSDMIPPLPLPSTEDGSLGHDFLDGKEHKPPKFSPAQKKQRKRVDRALKELERMGEE